MTGPSSRVPLLLVLVWLGGLLAATTVGLLAVRLVAAEVGDPAVTPLSAVAAASAAGSPAPGTAAPSTIPPSSAPSPSGAAAPTTVATTTAQTVATTGGTLGVQCSGTTLRLLYVTPAQGWSIDEREASGPEAEVRFTDGGTRLRVRLSCADGTPRLVEQRSDDDGGSGGDDD